MGKQKRAQSEAELPNASEFETSRIQNRRMEKDDFENKERYYKELVANSFDGIWLVKFDPPVDCTLPLVELVEAIYECARIVEANDNLAQMYGFEQASEIEGHYFKEWFPRTEKNMDFLRTFAQNNFRISNALSEEKDMKGNAVYIENSMIGILEDGHLIGTWGVQRDVTAKQKLEKSQDYYLKIEQTLGKISSLFLTNEDLDQCINIALRESGILLRVSRAYLFQTSENFSQANNTHEWVAPGVASEINRMQGLKVTSFPWWLEQLSQNRVIAASDIGQIPDPERSLLQNRDVVSVLTIPLFIGGRLAGFFGFDVTKKKREWLSEEITFLRTLSEIFARALEREESRKILKESEQRFQLFQSNVPDVIYRYDPENDRYDFISPSIESQTGYTMEEVSLHPREFIKSITHPEDWKRTEHKMNQQVEIGPPGKPFQVENRIICKDGTEIWVSDQKTLEFTKDGRLCRINGVVRDITTKKHTEVVLQENERFFTNIFSSIQDGLSILDSKLNIIQVNPKMEEWYSHAMPVVGKKCYQAYHGRNKPCEICPSKQTLQTGKTAYHVVPKCGPNGEVVGWLDLFSYPLVDTETGKMKGVIEYVRDISERKRAEEALKESEVKSRAILTAMPDLMFRFNKEGVFLDFKGAQDKLYLPPDHFLGKKVDEVMPAEIAQQCMHYIEQTLLTGRTQIFEYSLLMGKDLCYYEARLVTSGLNEILTIVRDITESKQAEKELKVYAQKLEEKNLELEVKNSELSATRAQLVQKEKLHALGQMASGMAHDFNNYLAIILGRAQLLRKRISDFEMEKGLAIIEKATQDASSTVKRIQNFARVRKDQEFKWVEINDLVEDVMAMTKVRWKDQAEAMGVTIKLKVEKDRRKLPPVKGDESELKEVLTNLIFNAVEAMPQGGDMVIKTWTDRNSVFVSISDTGEGIPDEMKRKIFDPFFTTKGVKNSGLGLSVAYGIIQRHGGDIWAENHAEKGTTMRICLPVRHDLKEISSEEIKGEPVPSIMSSAHILVIEDDEEIRQLLFDILKPNGYHLAVSSNGAEGLKLYETSRFDLVITDLGMPEMSGWEVTQAIKKIHPHKPVLLLTGWGIETDQQKLKDSQVDQIISKPIQVDCLLRIVAEMLEPEGKMAESTEERV